MEAVKRIELVVPEFTLQEVTAVLERHRVGGYTLARGLTGRGDRGVQSGEGLAGEFSNAWILVVCPEGGIGPMLEDLRALLRRFGGMCLVSDAMGLRH